MTQVKIAHITTVDDSLYGLLLNQMHSQQQAGYDVIGISNPGGYVTTLEQSGIRHVPIRMTRNITPYADLAAVFRLVRILRQEGVVIAHTHTPKAGLLGQLAARIAGTPIVINTIHGFYFHDRMASLQRQFYISLERVAALCSTSILSQNREDIQTAHRLRLCRPDKIKYLGNGIDLKRFNPGSLTPANKHRVRETLGIGPDTPVVGFVGRLAGRRKGFLDVVAAAQLLVNLQPDVRFLVIGESDHGKPDAVDPAIIHTQGLSDHFYLMGARNNAELPQYYAAMDLLVLPSLFEGVPRVVMEAAAMGVPAVVSDVKGNREAIVADQTGTFVPYGDPAALAAAINTLLMDRQKLSYLGRNARQFALAHFDETRVFSSVLMEYHHLLQHWKLQHA